MGLTLEANLRKNFLRLVSYSLGWSLTVLTDNHSTVRLIIASVCVPVLLQFILAVTVSSRYLSSFRKFSNAVDLGWRK